MSFGKSLNPSDLNILIYKVTLKGFVWIKWLQSPGHIAVTPKKKKKILRPTFQTFHFQSDSYSVKTKHSNTITDRIWGECWDPRLPMKTAHHVMDSGSPQIYHWEALIVSFFSLLFSIKFWILMLFLSVYSSDLIYPTSQNIHLPIFCYTVA